MNSRQGQEFSFIHSFQTGSVAHSASYPIRNGVLSSGVKWPGSEDDPTCPPCAEMNGGALPPLSIHIQGIVINQLSAGTTIHLHVIVFIVSIYCTHNLFHFVKCCCGQD
jgi:hypothetical protein